jgi:hypothetical protein
MMTPIAVLERVDGSLWTYNDAMLVTLYHELAPDALVQVVIIGHDPAPPERD